LEVVLEKPKFLCVVQIFPNIIVHVAELDLEGSMPSLLYGTGIDCCLLVDLNPSLKSIILLPAIELKILAPFWAIFSVLSHLIYVLA